MDFHEVYNNHQKLVWNLISRFVFTKEDREDLFQDVFIKIHKALPKFKGESKIETWIYRITINTGINYAKKQQRQRFLGDLLRKSGIVRDKEEDISQKVETGNSLLKPLESLNPKQRMIILLAEVQEMNLVEIAEHMKIPVGTVKSNLHRAKEILKKEVIIDE
ncbi:MAG: RNA polymerase sigma factor [Candidatus Saganbacteria bacterium]|nr:RNA polymerase sigma factor [Candidatus Saganbacteria bacterium]